MFVSRPPAKGVTIKVAMGDRGPWPPENFKISTHFMLWEAVSQTNNCWSPKVKSVGPPNFWQPQNFGAGYATGYQWCHRSQNQYLYSPLCRTWPSPTYCMRWSKCFQLFFLLSCNFAVACSQRSCSNSRLSKKENKKRTWQQHITRMLTHSKQYLCMNMCQYPNSDIKTEVKICYFVSKAKYLSWYFQNWYLKLVEHDSAFAPITAQCVFSKSRSFCKNQKHWTNEKHRKIQKNCALS